MWSARYVTSEKAAEDHRSVRLGKQLITCSTALVPVWDILHHGYVRLQQAVYHGPFLP